MKILTITLLSFLMTNSFAGLTEDLDARREASAKKGPSDKKREFQRAFKELKETGIEQKSAQKGVKAPSFTIDGKTLTQRLKEKPLVVKFFRGHWCPYCVLELKAYQKHYNSIKSKGYDLIFLTPDTSKHIAKMKKSQEITMPIFQDKDNLIAKKFGVAFKVDEKVNEIYKTFGINLKDSQGNNNNELPMPGTYVIQKDGTISFAFADVDYTKRVDPRDLLKAL